MTVKYTGIDFAGFESIGGTTLECACGRTNYAVDGLYDGDEFTLLVKATARQPQHYVAHDGADGVMGVETGHGLYVDGCPCRTLNIIESFLQSHTSAVLKYFKEKLQPKADEVAKQLLDCNTAREAIAHVKQMTDFFNRSTAEARRRLGDEG